MSECICDAGGDCGCETTFVDECCRDYDSDWSEEENEETDTEDN